MGRTHSFGRTRRVPVRMAGIAFLLGIMLSDWQGAMLAEERVASAAPPSSTVTTGSPRTSFLRRLDGAAGGPVPQIGMPVRLRLPTINVDAAVEQVGLAPDGSMDVPKDFSEAAWYRLGPRPGEPGNAVIDGHVDSTTGWAVFWDLRRLTRGDPIVVVGDDGVERRFVVTGWEKYARQDVPIGRVFGPTTGIHLNLITCDQASTFDFTRREYAGNLIVYAEAAP